MPEPKNIHWTNDESLLEEYVLGHLPAEETLELERHLSHCDRCRVAVRAEQEVAAGVRRAGRDALKIRLARRLEQKGGSGMHWYRVAGVAAAIVVFITLGIYNRWFFAGGPPQAEIRLREDSVAPALGSPAIESKTQKMAPTQSLTETRKPGPVRKNAAAYADGAEKSKSAAGTGLARRSSAANIPVSRERVDVVAAGKEEIWVQGSMIPNQGDKQAALQNLKKDSGYSREKDLRPKEEARGLLSQVARTQGAAPQAQSVVVMQRPLLDLPGTQKSSKQKLFSVQTLFQRDTAGLRLTLYLDSLLSTGELSQAQIQAVRGDSIILQIGSRRIGYKMPPGWFEQRIKDLKKEK